MVAKRLGKEDWTRALRKIYDVMGSSPTETSRGELAATIGEPVRSLQSLLAVGREVGIFDHEYVRHPSGVGRASRYTVAVPFERAVEMLESYGWENITSVVHGPHRPALASDRDRGELRASAGPDPSGPFESLRPLRYNESSAVVEAARQHRERTAFVERQIAEFHDKGIRIDRSAFRVPRDARLEAIGLALPYIESLEKQVASLTSKVQRSGDVSELRTQLERTQADLRRCRDERRAEISAKVLAEQRAAARE